MLNWKHMVVSMLKLKWILPLCLGNVSTGTPQLLLMIFLFEKKKVITGLWESSNDNRLFSNYKNRHYESFKKKWSIFFIKYKRVKTRTFCQSFCKNRIQRALENSDTCTTLVHTLRWPFLRRTLSYRNQSPACKPLLSVYMGTWEKMKNMRISRWHDAVFSSL
jgi:hypothetical protein